MWNIIRVIRPGEAIPGNKKPAETFVYDAHLFQPKKGRTGSGSWSPLFTDDRMLFMRTPAEKARRKRRRLALWGTDKKTKKARQGRLERRHRCRRVFEAHPLLSAAREHCGRGFRANCDWSDPQCNPEACLGSARGHSLKSLQSLRSRIEPFSQAVQCPSAIDLW